MPLLSSLRNNLSNLQLYGLVSTTLFVWTLLSAFRQRSNFYSAAVYLSKSNACMMILWNQGIYQMVLFGKVMQKVFFGELRMVEVERLQERGWFAVTETLLALTIFKDEFDSSFVLLFVSLLFLKVFHWLAGDRVEMMEQSAHIPRRFHVRRMGLLSLLWIVDVALVLFAVESILLEGPTVMIMFASEYMILLATVGNTTLKYGINAIDSRSEVVWEDKSVYVFYVELVTDFIKLVTYLVFFCLILTFYGLPLNILRDVYITFRSFVVKCRDLGRYRQATRNMDSLYPSLSAEEMVAMVDKTCIICREDMEYRPAPGEVPVVVVATGEGGEPVVPPVVPPPGRTGPNDTPKKLPCGHSFHFHCLRSWLERQQSCPTCRRSVLPEELDRAQAAAAALAARGPPPPLPNGEDAIRQAQINLARNLGRDAFAVVFPGVPFPPEAARPAGAVLPPPLRTPTMPLAGTDNAPIPPPTEAPRQAAATPAVGSEGRLAGVGRGGNVENPLARFSLPQLQLPPTGEAGLYSAPASAGAEQSANYAGIAYGAYPTRGGRGRTVALGPSSRPNLEERLANIRSRMGPTPTPTVAPTAATTPTAPPALAPTPTASSSTAELSVREAALAAAERRAALMAPSTSAGVLDSPVSPLSLATPDPTTSIPSTPSLSIPPPASSASPSTPQQAYPPPSFNSLPPVSASSYPRLIPLFDPSIPRATTAYPHLLSSMPPALAYSLSDTPSLFPAAPLVPTSPTDAQMVELARMTRRGIEERLRVLVGFQQRMEEMARDMRGVLNVLPDDSAPMEAEEGERDEEGKGKRAMEGIHAREASST